MNITKKRTEIIFSGLEGKHCLQYCSHYGEHGYDDPKHLVLLANWNDVSGLTQNYLKELGCELEWSDEWTIDYNTSKAYRTAPDGYNWQSQVAITTDGELLTPDDDNAEWIAEYALTDYNQPMKALPDRISMQSILDEGYTRHNGTFESGFHLGQDDDPQTIAKNLFDEVEEMECVVFRIPEVSQFFIRFEVYYRVFGD